MNSSNISNRSLLLRPWGALLALFVWRSDSPPAPLQPPPSIIPLRVARPPLRTAVPPDTSVIDLGARIQAQAMRMGLSRAKEAFVVADGALWIWSLVEDRFSKTTKTFDFYHGRQHLWSLAHHLHPENRVGRSLDQNPS